MTKVFCYLSLFFIISFQHVIAVFPAIQMPDEDILIMKSLSSRTYSDAVYDHDNGVTVESSIEVIKGIRWTKFPFHTETTADSSIGTIYHSQNPAALIVSFHGSWWLKDWLVDLNAVPSPASSLSPNLSGKVHTGFLGLVQDCYTDMRNKIRTAMGRDLHPHDEIHFTGHSLGGALATLAAAKLSCEISFNSNHLKIISFSTPRGVIGDSEFIDRVYKRISLLNILCFSTQGDIVPHLTTPIYSYSPLGINIEIAADEKITAHYTQPILGTLNGIIEHPIAPVLKCAIYYYMGWTTGGVVFVAGQYFSTIHGLPCDEPLIKAFQFAKRNYNNSSMHPKDIGTAALNSAERNPLIKFIYYLFI